MSGLVRSDRKLSASFTFPQDFIGFEGHFPTKKILPGVCQIECVAAMLEAWNKRHIAIREVVNAKYLLPVLPSEELSIECTDVDSAADELVVKVQIKRAGQRVTELKLKVNLCGNKQ